MDKIIKPHNACFAHPGDNTLRLNRIRNREIQKCDRERQLFSLKNTTLPIIKPALPRGMNEKCKNCHQKQEIFINPDHWYLDYVNVLESNREVAENHDNWLKKAAVWTLCKIFSFHMDSLVVHPAQIEMIKHLQISKPKSSIVFVMNTDNLQLDLVLVNLILQINDVKCPLIILKKELQNITVLCHIMHDLKVIFVDNGQKIKESEMIQYLKTGENILLLLNENCDDDLGVMMNSCEFEHGMEILLLPISINYERTSCIKKPRGTSFLSFYRDVFNEHYGIIRVSFHEPYYIRELVKASISDIDNHKLKIIRDHLVSDIMIKRPIMSTNAIAFIMMTYFRNGTTMHEVSDKLEELVTSNPQIDFGFHGLSADIAERGLELLGKDLLNVSDGIIKPSADLNSLVKLCGYAKYLVPHFMFESILVIAAQHLKRSQSTVDYHKLIETALDLCELLECEIPLNHPCVDKINLLHHAFDELSMRNIMTKPVVQISENAKHANRLAAYLDEIDFDTDFEDESVDSLYCNPLNEVTFNNEKLAEIEDLQIILMPTLDLYLTVAYCLKKIIGAKSIAVEKFIKASFKAMQEECEDGNCKYWESCNSLWIDSCLKRLETWQVIELRETENGRMMIIHDDYNNMKSINHLIAKIERFLF